MDIVFKLAVLIFCIRQVMANGRPGIAAAIYAGVYLALGCTLLVIGTFSLMQAMLVALMFIYDFVTGFVFFWLIDRYQDAYFIFFAIIVLALASTVAIKFILVYLLRGLT